MRVKDHWVLSSIEPNRAGTEVDAAEKAAIGFVEVGGDGAEPLEFGEDVLGQVACLSRWRSAFCGAR